MITVTRSFPFIHFDRYGIRGRYHHMAGGFNILIIQTFLEVHILQAIYNFDYKHQSQYVVDLSNKALKIVKRGIVRFITRAETFMALGGKKKIQTQGQCANEELQLDYSDSQIARPILKSVPMADRAAFAILSSCSQVLPLAPIPHIQPF